METEMYNNFQTYICIIFVTVQLAKANHMTKLRITLLEEKDHGNKGRPLVGVIHLIAYNPIFPFIKSLIHIYIQEHMHMYIDCGIVCNC